LLVEKYLEAAEAVAARAVASRLDQIAPCTVSNDVPGCGRGFVRNFGARVFRRPLSATEAQLFDDLFMRASQAGYAASVTLVLQAMLQSPQFLYRVDSLKAPTPESGAIAIGGYELASRLSFFLTGSMPDAELFKAAAENRLSTDAEVELQTRRLLETPRAREMVREYHRQWLGLDALPSTARDAAELGEGARELGKDWLGSLDRFVDHVYWENGNVSALFNSPRVYLTPRLATLYGAPAPTTDFAAADLSNRAGLLTQPGLLALLAHSNQSAPVLRGVFVREQFMCQPIPPPPPTVNSTPPDPDPNATTRERFRVHTEKPECSGCHQLIDGVGFGFEGYDHLGRFRTVENGMPVDTRGEVLRASDPALDGPFTGVAELSARLGQSQRVRDCVAAGWYRFALGRLESEADSCSLNEVKLGFQKSGGSLRELFVAITRSVAFRYRPAMPEAGQ
jgi:hypothetical protein